MMKYVFFIYIVIERGRGANERPFYNTTIGISLSLRYKYLF